MSATKLTIDRVEGTEAVVECGDEYYSIPLAILPEGTSEGDSITLMRSPPDDTQAKSRLDRLKQRDDGSKNIDLYL